MATKKKKIKKKATGDDFIREANEEIQKTLEKVSGDLTPEEKQRLEEALKKIFTEGVPTRKALDFDEQAGKVLYDQAFLQFNSGHYKMANTLFKLLVIFDPSLQNYHGLAASHHMMGDYARAIELYFSYAAMDPESPVPFFHMYDCFTKLKNPMGGYAALKGALRRCGDTPEHDNIKKRCTALLEGIKKQLGIELTKEDEAARDKAIGQLGADLKQKLRECIPADEDAEEPNK